jgi:MFS family permease
VDGNVVSLGITSFFTDISSEMVTAILPIYLTIRLGLSPFQFGAFDGLYQVMAVVAAIGAGARADRRRRHKEMAGAGYALSAGCKLGLLASFNHWLPTTAFLYLDRTGKGLRTAPRDALISLSAPRHRLAEAFGVHRALDTAGALAGPVVAFAILAVAPRAYDAVFACSFLIALVGLGVLVFFVQNRATAPLAPERLARRAGSFRAALTLLRTRRFRALVVGGALVGLLTVSDSFVYLTFQRRASIDLRWFPLLFVGASVVYLVLAVPVGRLADRVGRARVFVAGQVLLVGTYSVVALPQPGPVHLLAVFALFGGYYAATDGILAAMAADALPARQRGTGLAVLTTAVTAAHAAGAIAFGWSWSHYGPRSTLVVFAACLAMATVVVRQLLAGTGPGPVREASS